MNDIWSFGLETLEELGTAHPATPLIVLPSSFYFTKPRPNFRTIFRDRTAPVRLFCRERYSLDILRDLELEGDVQLGLDEDMAFKLGNSDWFADLLESRRAENILVVERADPEGATGLAVQRTSNLQRLRKLTPAPLRSLADAAVLARRRRKAQRPEAVAQLPTDFARDLVQRVRDERPETAELPVYYLDIAKLSYATYDDYCGLVARAAAVVTTRLHVAILGGMLGKPTYCKTGSYHKMKGVYEHSLATMDHVTLI
jgi:exopolysaccharide biosynthesis predicted pyruvyltransferase EpsI